jgi:hypothetical protein
MALTYEESRISAMLGDVRLNVGKAEKQKLCRQGL